MAFRKGETVILYIKDEGTYKPIGCLTSNSSDESVDMLQTTTRESNGWKTSIPTNQDLTINFEGLQSLEDTTGTLTYLDLKVKKRSKVRLEWKLEASDASFTEEGFGYINAISDASPAGDFLTFNGTIQNYGVPLLILGILDLFQDGAGFLFQSGAGMLFN